MSPPNRLTCLFVFLAVAVVACGGDSNATPSSTTDGEIAADGSSTTPVASTSGRSRSTASTGAAPTTSDVSISVRQSTSTAAERRSDAGQGTVPAETTSVEIDTTPAETASVAVDTTTADTTPVQMDTTPADTTPIDSPENDTAENAASTGAVAAAVPDLVGETSTHPLIPQSWAPFASFSGVILIQPSINIERIGFHESDHDGAQQLDIAANTVFPIVLESRGRGTGSRTAADVVVKPDTEIRAPVTGTVIRAGGYVLDCDHRDGFVVIEPDAHPGWEVNVVHITGVQVSPGDRVEAGVTVLAPGATDLPFDSQIDSHTAEPSWPHVQIELLDPAIPARLSPGDAC